MALHLSTSAQQGARATRTNRSSRPCRLVVVSSSAHKHQQAPQALSRRSAAGGVAGLVLANLLSSAPARAGLFGFDDDAEVQAKYAQETADILDKVRGVIALDRDDPTKEEAVKALRKDINGWVAKYRREQRVSGRPSFGAMYAALNTLAGHYNSFGLTAPLPKKRMDNLQKELEDAAGYLARNR